MNQAYKAYPHIAARIFLLVMFLMTLSCLRKTAPTKPLLDPAGIDGSRAYVEVRNFLTVGPRVSGSPGGSNAVNYLCKRLAQLDIPHYVQEFTETTSDGDIVFRNIIAGTLDNTERRIIIASHYDTKAGIDTAFVGANDSGSSTGLLLEIARAAYRSNMGGSFIFLFLDGEECRLHYSEGDGLHGSRYIARDLLNRKLAGSISAVIVLDMIGDRNLNISIPRNSSSELISIFFKAAREENARHLFSLYPGEMIDDHVPFANAGIRSVNLIDFHYGSEPGKNNYWHTTNDTIDKLSADSLEIAGRVTVRALNHLISEHSLHQNK